MNTYGRIAAALATAAASIAVTTGTAAAATPVHDFDFGSGGDAVFVQSDNTTANTVVSYERLADGTLAQLGVYPTGGQGGALGGAAVDDLASQDSLVYDRDHRLLFAVNAGSNTISVFAVRGTQLSLTQVIGSGGTFPVSIAVHRGLVYVLNALGGGSLQGYVIDFGRLIQFGPSVPLGLNPTQTPQFTSTPGEVAFTPDGRQLVVTTKGNGSDIDVFAVSPFGISSTPVVNSEPGAVPFGFVFGPGGLLDVAEAGPSAVASFALSAGGTVQQLALVPTGQPATCWLVGDLGVLYASNAGGPSISSLSAAPWGPLLLFATTTTDPGTVDATTSPDGRFLYVQTGHAGIVDEFAVSPGGALSEIGSVLVPGAVGGEGIAAS